MAKVNFVRRLTKDEINNVNIEDGNFIITKDGGLFTDYGNERINLIPSLAVEFNELLKSLGLYENTYDSTLTYEIGDLVVYNHSVYECNTAITTAEEFDSTKWDVVPIITN